jgi:hypothetical protein
MMIHSAGPRPPFGGVPGGGYPQRPDPATLLAPAAQLLGLSTNALQQSLRNGSSLHDIALSQGIGQDDLISALKDGIVAAKPSSTPALATADRLDQMAQAIASAPGGRIQGLPPDERSSRGPSTPRGADRTDGSALTNVAALLKMSTDDLVASLLNGSSLKDLATQKGVDTSAILDAAKRGLALDTTM